MKKRSNPLISRFLTPIFSLIFLLAVTMSQAASAKETLKLVIIGDDLMSGKGLVAEEDKMEHAIERAFIHQKKSRIDVVNLSQDGATTAWAMMTVPQILAERPAMVMIAVGVNDAVTQVNPDVVYSNMDNLLKELVRSGAYVLLIGPEAPKTTPYDYALQFNTIFPSLSQHYPVIFMQGLMKDIEGDPNLTQADRLHPNQFGVEAMADKLTDIVWKMDREVRHSRACQDPRTRRNTANCDYYLFKETNK